MTLQQRRAASSDAITRATRLEARLHAFVELSALEEISSKTGSLAFLPYAAKDLFLGQTAGPAADSLRQSNLIVPFTPMYCTVSMRQGPRASGSPR
jgi:hypothetical protein